MGRAGAWSRVPPGDAWMRVVALCSQKGGSGKTTLWVISRSRRSSPGPGPWP